MSGRTDKKNRDRLAFRYERVWVLNLDRVWVMLFFALFSFLFSGSAVLPLAQLRCCSLCDSE